MSVQHVRLGSVGSSLENLVDEEKKISDGEALLKTADVAEGKAGFASGFINLMKTILGSGMLSLPVAMASIGVVPGIILLTVAALFSAFGLHILSVCADKVGRKSSVFVLSQVTYPKVGILFDIAVIIKCFGVASSYLVVIRKLMPVIALALGAEEGSTATSYILWLSVFLIAISPLSFLRKVDKLKYTSFFGLVAVAYMVLLSIALFTKTALNGELSKIDWFVPLVPAKLNSIGIFIFSFTCHQNLFPIKNEAKDNSIKRTDLLISASVVSSLIVYGVFGLLCYGVYGSASNSNIFLNFPVKHAEFVIARFLFVFLMAFSYPLQTYPCKTSILKVIPIPLRIREKYSFLIENITILLILVGTYLVAFFFDDLSYLTSLVGSTASVIICYILPFIFYYKLTENDGWKLEKILCAAMAIFGVLAIPFFLVTFFLKQ